MFVRPVHPAQCVQISSRPTKTRSACLSLGLGGMKKIQGGLHPAAGGLPLRFPSVGVGLCNSPAQETGRRFRAPTPPLPHPHLDSAGCTPLVLLSVFLCSLYLLYVLRWIQRLDPIPVPFVSQDCFGAGGVLSVWNVPLVGSLWHPRLWGADHRAFHPAGLPPGDLLILSFLFRLFAGVSL